MQYFYITSTTIIHVATTHSTPRFTTTSEQYTSGYLQHWLSRSSILYFTSYTPTTKLHHIKRIVIIENILSILLLVSSYFHDHITIINFIICIFTAWTCSSRGINHSYILCIPMIMTKSNHIASNLSSGKAICRWWNILCDLHDYSTSESSVTQTILASRGNYRKYNRWHQLWFKLTLFFPVQWR